MVNFGWTLLTLDAETRQRCAVADDIRKGNNCPRCHCPKADLPVGVNLLRSPKKLRVAANQYVRCNVLNICSFILLFLVKCISDIFVFIKI